MLIVDQEDMLAVGDVKEPESKPLNMPEVSDLVNRLVWEADQRAYRFERRREDRHSFPHLLDLMPVLEESTFSPDETITVVGRDISRTGLRFYHTNPLPFRQSIVCLPWSRTTGLLLELRWARFVRNGWYESGGSFLGIVQMPEIHPS